MCSYARAAISYSMDRVKGVQHMTDLVVAALVAVVAAAFVGCVIVKVHRVGTASVMAGIQPSCLISSIHTEAAQNLQDIPENEHVGQHPACKGHQKLDRGATYRSARS